MDAHALQVLGFEDLRQVLLGYAPSELSRRVIRVLTPSPDRERLLRSLQQVNEARELSDAGRPVPVRGLREIVPTLKRGHHGQRALEPEELNELHGFLEAISRIRQFFKHEGMSAPTLSSLAERLREFPELAKAIERVVEPPGVVKDRASPKLFDLRARARDLEEQIRLLMSELASGPRFKAHLMERTFSIRNGHYVLPIKLEHRGHVPGILHDRSASGGTAFIEPEEVVALSNELADIRIDETREVTRLLLELSRMVYAVLDDLTKTEEVAAWLEFTYARAQMSQDLGLLPARLSSDMVLRLRQGRHPLLLVARKAGTLEHDVVPVSVTLGESCRVLVVTGPNTGGKTVALKTVGLIQLMFQCGLHLPVGPGTELPCFEVVGADIGDEQSLSQSLSTFSGHIRNIVHLLKSLGPKSLILLDELGAGTDPTEGAALGHALLERLRERGALAMVTTHLGMLKAYAFSRPDVENASVTFDVASLRPTYELVVGQPGASQALHIAERHGLDPDLVSEARKLLSEDKGKTDRLMDELQVSRVAAERARQHSENLVLESEHRLKEARLALTDAQAERGRVEREAESEVARVLDDLIRDARPHLNALKNVPKSLLPEVTKLEDVLTHRARNALFADRRREFLSGLKKNDQVYVPRYGQVCRIEKFMRSEERLTIRMGAISVEIAFDDVSWVTPPDAPRT